MRPKGTRPGTPALDLALLDAERPVDRPGLPRQEHAPAVADQHLRGAEALDRLAQDHQVGGQILPRREQAGQQGTAVILQHGDDVDGLRGGEAVVLDVADIDRPDLVATGRRERVRPRLAGRGFRTARGTQVAM